VGNGRVIKLVTQFDDPETHPTGATPSGASSSSSCCCCCVVTAIGTSVLSGLHIRSVRQWEREPESASPNVRAPVWPEVLGFIALALAIGVLVLSLSLAPNHVAGWIVAGSVAVWLAVLYAAYRGARDPHPIGHAFLTLIAAGLAALVEFFIWAAVLAG
jgi:hypothetical protein